MKVNYKNIMKLSNKRHWDSLTSERVKAILSNPEMSEELVKAVKMSRCKLTKD